MTAPNEPENPSNLFSPFLEATFNIPEEEDRLRAYLNDKLSDITDVLNDKMIGSFTDGVENFSGGKWSYDTTKKVRNGYQAIFRVKSFIPQVINIPFQINPQFIISEVYGSASKPCSVVGEGDGVYFSFMSQGDARIQFQMTDNTITITTNGTTDAYQGFIILEYIHDGI